MKRIRSLHLYLGCFFAPLIAFFAFSGILQTFELHEAHKGDPYQPPAWVKALGRVHMKQNLAKDESATAMKVITVAMAICLVLTMALGVVLAFKSESSRVAVALSLVLGTVIPTLAVWVSHSAAAP